ncbi:hypothetical protein D910_04291 [Dendroctonus ponderosae]|uniref:Uncharacterized protein n=1 Tax=Dendroctonus ponderosae TaxID=77166 RepID=U4U3J9_DENPD|nr:hypothetical protein D910_04291 [Dendroctonus ponderosae]
MSSILKYLAVLQVGAKQGEPPVNAPLMLKSKTISVIMETIYSRMCIDESSEPPHLPENLSVSASKQGVNFDLKDSPVLRLKQPPAGSYSLHSTPSNSPLLNQRHPGTGVPIISHKDFMQKALNVPPTPSPDSAVHSAYSVFSSPNQSPLTQRHVTLTPNLSRNNSDASHSSCCSYSSVSVSVSPTQQFSPTHSPIQTVECTGLFTLYGTDVCG